MAKLFSTAGSKIYIGPAKAYEDTDFTSTDFPSSGGSAITWVEIKGHTNLGGVGDTSELITSDHIGIARTRKLKGTRNAGSMTLVCDLDYSDAGQAALLAAEAARHSYAFKIVLNDAPPGGTPSIRFFVAYVMQSAEEFNEANSVMKLNATLEVDSNVVRVNAAPADP